MKTVDISGAGMGEHYERTCQKLLWAGIKYLSRVDNAKDLFKGTGKLNYKALEDTSFFGEIPLKKGDTLEISGILVTPPTLKEMENEMSKAVDGDWTGMQHETVIGHLQKIAEFGYEWWLNEFKDQPHRIYEIDVNELLGEDKR